LQAGQVLPYLLEAGFISQREAVFTGIKVDTSVRKNTSYQVKVGDRHLLVKQPKLNGDPGIEREVEFYFSIREKFERLRAISLQPLGYGSSGSWLVLPFLNDAPDLRQFHARARYAPVRLGREIGRTLAVLHDTGGGKRAAGTLPPAPAPWVFMLRAPDVSILETESGGSLAVLKRIQANEHLRALIDHTSIHWVSHEFCHGDLRLDNLLYSRERALILVDWELCGLGWAAWDVACLLANYVEVWVNGATRPASLEDSKKIQTRKNIVSFKPLLVAFWSEYRHHRRLDGGSTLSPHLLAQLVALRMLQSALEYSQGSPVPTRESIMLLTVATRFATRPVESWVHILGIPMSPLTGTMSER